MTSTRSSTACGVKLNHLSVIWCVKHVISIPLNYALYVGDRSPLYFRKGTQQPCLLSETARPLTDNSHPRAMADLFNPLEETDVSRATIDEEDERIAEEERAEAGDGPKVFGVVRALITETANAFTGPNPNPRLPRSSSATSPTPNHSGTQEYALQFLQVAFPAAS